MLLGCASTWCVVSRLEAERVAGVAVGIVVTGLDIDAEISWASPYDRGYRGSFWMQPLSDSS